ncbi:MAG: hypothetical protein ABIH46_05435 [Chloroflexota bacterium]
MTSQRGLFEEAKVEVKQPERRITVLVGTRAARVPLRKKRREALQRLMGVLDQLEGKDVFISTYGGAHNHFWLHNLKLGKLKVERFRDGGNMPSVIVLWGSKGASVRMFTDQMVSVREQDYEGYTVWLVDFWNGFGEHPIDPYRPKGYVSLNVVRFKK